MEYLIGLVAILAGLFVYERSKREAAESLNNNLETKGKVQQEQAKMDKVDAKIAVEETKRAELGVELQRKLEEQTNENLTNFFNDRLNNDK